MAEYQITHIRKPHTLSPHEHITHVGRLGSWILTREEVIIRIEQKKETFFVLDNKNHRSNVGVIRPTDGRLPFLRTHADGDWNNNLLSLPQF